MGSEFPPLPQAQSLGARITSVALQSEAESLFTSLLGDSCATGTTVTKYTSTVVEDGDLVIEYINDHGGPPSKATIHQWQVNSKDLIQSSPYFRALLDPSKFAEGRQFHEQKKTFESIYASSSPNAMITSDDEPEIPVVQIPTDETTRFVGVDAMEMFFRILCMDSLTSEDRHSFQDALRILSPAPIAKLIEIADRFNSPEAVRKALHSINYRFGNKRPAFFAQFRAWDWKTMAEDRIRQYIYVSLFLKLCNCIQVSSHALVVRGSQSWVDSGPEQPAPTCGRWRYLPDGVEEELYYRRQCVMNTITDLQAHFLRLYRALDDPSPPKHLYTTAPLIPSSTHQIQCRGGLSNSRECDIFQLGQMIRFFSMRSKTIFLGSTLLDPEFDIENHQDGQTNTKPPSDITGIIASLKQYPDYQIDTNHSGCGIRRRFLPALECIEKYIMDGRGLLGINLSPIPQHLMTKEASWSYSASTWTHEATISHQGLAGVRHLFFSNTIPAAPPEHIFDDAGRMVFSAKKRIWEA
ncbi:hypothetical protein N7474_004831 [Penicillium riverlandense]|uniref:uncharacterized protein n=1 Tax=Penicillium riverlandense TaxID=1903569 RepID=UPI002548F087|nr:uncharacterized protein N7474_004831 [Penicillium riverlandense]KAJ5819240.1 hypothetical protein N7474_004831 [Penicillium riverlandense]